VNDGGCRPNSRQKWLPRSRRQILSAGIFAMSSANPKLEWHDHRKRPVHLLRASQPAPSIRCSWLNSPQPDLEVPSSQP